MPLRLTEPCSQKKVWLVTLLPLLLRTSTLHTASKLPSLLHLPAHALLSSAAVRLTLCLQTTRTCG